MLLPGGGGSDIFAVWNTSGTIKIKDFDLNEDKLYLQGFSNKTVSATGGKITVGSKTNLVEIFTNDQLDQDKANSIINASDPKYKFVTSTFNTETRRNTYTEQ